MRLNKYLSDIGYCSRREADRLIEAGKVYVDGVQAGVHEVAIGSEMDVSEMIFGLGHDNSEYRIGYVCEVKFWDTTLSSNQVAYDYQRFIGG